MRAVIDLWLDRTRSAGQATLADVAEALDATVEDVEALLEEAHARRRALDNFDRPHCRTMPAPRHIASQTKSRRLPPFRLSIFCDSMMIVGMICMVAWTIFTLQAI